MQIEVALERGNSWCGEYRFQNFGSGGSTTCFTFVEIGLSPTVIGCCDMIHPTDLRGSQLSEMHAARKRP
jgi:hypothetical protein